MKNKNGFTLAEFSIAVFMIALLLMMIIPTIIKIRAVSESRDIANSLYLKFDNEISKAEVNNIRYNLFESESWRDFNAVEFENLMIKSIQKRISSNDPELQSNETSKLIYSPSYQDVKFKNEIDSLINRIEYLESELQLLKHEKQY